MAEKTSVGLIAGAAVLATLGAGTAHAWEPAKPVEFVIPAGTGGGADQMARFIQGVITKHNLMKQPMVVVNKGGGAGAEGFLEVKKAAGDAHKIIITLSNLFTTPYGTGVPFSHKEMTPVAMLALDQFVLWVNKDALYKTAKEYIDAVKAGNDKSFKMGGTGSKQEDQIITAALERVTAPKKFVYIPYKGGGEVATQLVGGHVNSTVNNPIEAVAQWRGGALRPLCIFDGKRSTYTNKVTETQAGATFRRARSRACPPSTRCCAVSSCRRASSPTRSHSTSISSRRSARHRTGRSSWKRARSTTPSRPETSSRSGSKRPTRRTST